MTDPHTSRWRGWLIVPALLLAVPLSSWAIGRNLEGQLDEYRAPLLQAIPWLHVVARRYDKGVFSSREELDVEIQLDAISRRFTIVNELQHGPFTGLAMPALARMRSSLQLQGTAAGAARELFGDRSPVTVRTTLGLLGGGRSEISVPELDTTVGEERAHITWKGFEGDCSFSRTLAHVEAHATAPLLRLATAQGEIIELVGLAMKSSGDRVFEDLYSGSGEVALQRMHVVQAHRAPIDASGVSYVGEVPVNGEFVDLIARIGADHARIAGVEYGPAHYDVSFRHLHGPTLAGLLRELQKLADPSAKDASAAADPVAKALLPKLDAGVLSSFRQLLLAQPRLVVDRISAATPQGPFSIRGEVHFVALNADDLATNSFAALLMKLEAQADLSVPVTWAGLAGATAIAGRGPPQANTDASAVAVDAAGEIYAETDTPEAVAARSAETVTAELDGLQRRGFIERHGDLLTTHLELRQGKLLLNGHAFGE